MSASSPVSAGDDILAAAYNNLREDVLDPVTGHDHEGVEGKVLGAGALGTDSVVTTKIKDGNVIAGKLATDSVLAGKIKTGIGSMSGSLGAGMGIYFLKESYWKTRITGALILTLGLVLIGLSR